MIENNNKRPACMSDEEFLKYAWSDFTKEFLYPLLAAMGTAATAILIIARFL